VSRNGLSEGRLDRLQIPPKPKGTRKQEMETGKPENKEEENPAGSCGPSPVVRESQFNAGHFVTGGLKEHE